MIGSSHSFQRTLGFQTLGRGGVDWIPMAYDRVKSQFPVDLQAS
jgi:hypothetical protein